MALSARHEPSRRARELAAVHQIAARVSSAASGEVLVATILEGASQAINCDAVALYLCRQPEGVELLAARGFTPDERLALDARAAQYLCHRGETSMADSAQAPLSEDSQAGVLCAPLSVDGRPIGALFLGSRGGGGLGADDYHVAVAIADHVAVAIADARQLRTGVRRLSALRGSSESIAGSLQTQMVLREITREAGEALAPSSVAIGLLDEDDREVTCVSTHLASPAEDFRRRWPLSGSFGEWILEHGAPLVVPPAAPSELATRRTPVASFLGVAISVKGHIVGFLFAYSRERLHYQQRDVELMQALAVQAAIALEQASLQELMNQEKAKFEAIVESLQEGVVLVDPRGSVAYASARFVDLVGVDARSLPNMTIDGIFARLAAATEHPDETRASLAALEVRASAEATVSLVRPPARVLSVQRFGVQGTESPLGSGYLVRDVTQRGEVEHLKNSILGMVSHELRTPLAAIKGFASALLQDSMVWDRASEHDFLLQIEREADRLTALVSNLLDMSRLEAGTLTFEWEPCDLLELLEDVLRRFAPLGRDHPLELIAEPNALPCVIDRRFLERVVWNLLDNAVKYSPTASPIVVRAGARTGGLYFSVEDRGVGINADETDRIFDRFYRGTSDRAIAGCGLGLAICRAIVDQHGGSVTVESQVGSGSTFTVVLPCRTTRQEVEA